MAPVWFITGCSSGFGKEIALRTLKLGYPTVVTARHLHDLVEFATYENALCLELDVTNNLNELNSVVKKAEDKFGKIDVLVNNAGYGYFGSIEESEEDQIQKIFDVNVFGMGKMIKAVLPGMRKQKSGMIINISSLAGICPCPGLGYYTATKFAVDGMSGALMQEVKPLGIKVMVVAPSQFRTDWAGRSASKSNIVIEDYAATSGAKSKQLLANDGKQAGNPFLAAKEIVEAVESENPPHHLLLGNASYSMATGKLEELKQEYLNWAHVSKRVDFPKD